MQHYLVERTAVGDLLSAFPHSPEDRLQTYEDYLEDKFASGWSVVSFGEDSSFVTAVFIPNAV